METSISRRHLLLGGAGTLMAAGVSTAATETDENANHEHGEDEALAQAARTCVADGEVCIAHCLALFATGDTSLAACAKAVTEMVTACRAIASLASLEAKRLEEFLGPCISVCADCEQECRKHADKHPVCRACAEACAGFIAEAKKVKTAPTPVPEAPPA
jgi:Cys-rich four helix bundle protein (predicted Tat secretion target)